MRAARQDRELDFLGHGVDSQGKERARLFHHEIPATHTYWQEHCVVCFVEDDAFDHPRERCPAESHVNRIVSRYWTRMDAKWGKGMCWSCLLPANCCPGWRIEDTGRVRTQSLGAQYCVGKHAVRDTWAVLWESCPKAKALWLEWIRKEEGDPNWDDTSDALFQGHFARIMPFGDDYKASQLVLGLNWLTQTHFLTGRYKD